MKSQKNILLSCTYFFLTVIFFPTILQATEFGAMVIPSLMDSELDGWHKIPPNSGPNIHKVSELHQGQAFNLLVFFNGYSSEKNNNVHVRYDVQIFDPKGNQTEDKGADILAYQGPIKNPNVLILPQQFLKIGVST